MSSLRRSIFPIGPPPSFDDLPPLPPLLPLPDISKLTIPAPATPEKCGICYDETGTKTVCCDNVICQGCLELLDKARCPYCTKEEGFAVADSHLNLLLKKKVTDNLKRTRDTIAITGELTAWFTSTVMEDFLLGQWAPGNPFDFVEKYFLRGKGVSDPLATSMEYYARGWLMQHKEELEKFKPSSMATLKTKILADFYESDDYLKAISSFEAIVNLAYIDLESETLTTDASNWLFEKYKGTYGNKKFDYKIMRFKRNPTTSKWQLSENMQRYIKTETFRESLVDYYSFKINEVGIADFDIARAVLFDSLEIKGGVPTLEEVLQFFG